MDRIKQPVVTFIGTQYLENIKGISSSILALKLRHAGYFSAEISSKGTWVEQNAWLLKYVQSNNYSWLENKFWFTYEQDAVIFALRWS